MNFTTPESALNYIKHIIQAIENISSTQHNAIRWHAMIGMRNRIIHGYFEINLLTVWQTIQKDLPVLHTKLTKLLTDCAAK